MCVIMPAFIKIGQIIAEMWRLTFFSKWRPTAVRHIGYVERMLKKPR